jgi:hypothetical protein
MKTRFFTRTAPLLLMFMLIIPLSAQADPMYEYTYTGGPFTNDGGPDFPLPPSSYSLTISFTFGAITAADLGVNIASLVSNFSISDGPLTFTTPYEIVFGANDAGDTTVPETILDEEWYVLVYGSSPYLTQFTMLAQGLPLNLPNSFFPWPPNYAGDTGTLAYENGPTDYGYNGGGRVWTVTPIPEPASVLLVASGLLGLAAYRRRFKKP